MNKLFSAFILICLLPAGFSAAQNTSANSPSREALRSTARAEAAALSSNRIPAADLGDWKQVIDASLFMLMRRTEISRGQVQVLVISSDQVVVKFLPDGSFIISSALLDYIDLSIFSTLAESARRIRNIDVERENRLSPFLAYEIAAFALDQNWRALTDRAAAERINLTREADGFARLLLDICGYPPDSQDLWFDDLERASRESGSVFTEYLKNSPRPQTRKTAMSEDADRTEALAMELKTVLFALREGAALDNNLKTVINLQEVYPASPYLKKLAAFFHHRLFLSATPAETLYLVPLLPFATGQEIDRGGFTALLQKSFSDPRTPQPEANEHYTQALSGYAEAQNHFEDSLLLSAQATLLSLSAAPARKSEALRLAELAALREQQETGFLSNANWAWVLFYTANDRERARQITANSLILQERTLNQPLRSDRNSNLLTPGYPANSLDLSLNLALISHAENNQERSDETARSWRAAAVLQNSDSVIALRGIATGNTATELEKAWGRPAEIINDYQTEYWYYPSLRARIILNTSSTGLPRESIRALYLESGSPVSLPGDIRCGDSREDFEAVYGKPAYRSGDSEVYLRGANRIAVFYLSDKIRQLSISY